MKHDNNNNNKTYEVCYYIKRYLLFWYFKKLLHKATETLPLKYAESSLKLNKNLEFLSYNLTYRLNSNIEKN